MNYRELGDCWYYFLDKGVFKIIFKIDENGRTMLCVTRVLIIHNKDSLFQKSFFAWCTKDKNDICLKFLLNKYIDVLS